MQKNHQQLSSAFQYLHTRSICVADANFDEPDTKIIFSTFHYDSELLESAFEYLQKNFNESINMFYSMEKGLVISMGEYSFFEDEPTEIVDESVCVENEPARELEIPETGYATEYLSKGLSKEFGFFL